MIKNAREVAMSGCVAVYNTQTADKVFVFGVKKDSDVKFFSGNIHGKNIYFPTDYSSDEALVERLTSLLNDVIKPYWGIKVTPIFRDIVLTTSIGTTLTGLYMPTGLSSGYKQPPTTLVAAYLSGLGYDVTRLSSTIPTRPKVRDYSALRETPEGKELYELYASQLNSMGLSYAKDGLPTDLELLKNQVEQGSVSAILFYGPAGSGKSIAAVRMSNAMGAPLLHYCFNEGSSPEDLYGTYGFRSDGTCEFHIGILLKAFTEGYPIRLDELNYAPTAVQNHLNSFLDDSPVVEYQGMRFKRHPNFMVFATMNPGYGGTNELQPALKSRFTSVYVPKLTKEEFYSRMHGYEIVHGLSPLSVKFYSKLYELHDILEAQSLKVHECVDFTVRQAQRFSDAIHQRSLSFEEFGEAFNLSYTFMLALDNSASMKKLEAYLDEPVFNQALDALYKEYDLKVVPEGVSEEFPEFDSLLETEFETASSSDSSLGTAQAVSFDDNGDIDVAQDIISSTLGF